MGNLHPFPVIFATDGSARIEQAAQRFYQNFSIPKLRPIAVGVAELPDPAPLAGMKVDDRRRLIRQLRDATRAWVREAKPPLARAARAALPGCPSAAWPCRPRASRLAPFCWCGSREA